MDTNKDNTTDMEKELKTRFALLPQEIQDVVISSDYQMKLFDIAKKYKLTYEQLGVLEFNTTLTLVGSLSPADFEKTLAGDLNKKPEEMTPLIADVSDQVFKPIRALLMEQYTTRDEEETDESADTFKDSGVSIEKEPLKTTPPADVSENRDSMLASIENPTRSTPRVLNESQTPAPSTMPIGKSASATIPVPRAPYAGGAPTMDAIKQPIPMTAKPVGDILAGKLGGTFSVPTKETDHSMKNVGTTPTPHSGDAYREPIE